MVRRLPQFEPLVELGAQALPALARKLADADNFFALQLYDVLAQRGLAPTIRAPARGEAGEQGRAVAVATGLAEAMARQGRPKGSSLGS